MDACVIVKAPVEELYASGADAESDDEEILLLNVAQSEDVSTPRFVAEEEGRLKMVCWPELVMVKSLPTVEVAKVTAPLLVVEKPVPMPVIEPEPPPALMQVPLTAKQPVAKLIPFTAVVVPPLRASTPPT